LFANDDVTSGRPEEGEQGQLPLLASRSVPRDPNAVRRAELRGAEVSGELLLWEYISPVGHLAIGLTVRVVKGVDDQLAVHSYRLVPRIVEVQSPAKTTGGRLL